jgi:hypothetical protein
MESNLSVLQKIDSAKQMADRLSQTHPGDAPWSTLFKLLEVYEKQVRDHWPLTAAEKQGSKLGWFSVRNIEEVFPQLHQVLSEIAYSLRHSGE